MKEAIDNFKYERNYSSKGYSLIAGIDEAGRGPLAGPVVAACCIMDMDNIIEGITDSKKISVKRREKLFEEIKQNALCYGIGIVDEDKIEEINILNAAKLAMKSAYENMDKNADIVLVDAINNIGLNVETIGIVKGDMLSYTIGAASILAKVTRDRIMIKYHEEYPEYGFDTHKGYGTAKHRQAILEHGPCEIHRMKFLRKILVSEDKKNNTRILGKKGEDFAAKYLMSIGYEILCQNYWTKQGELDIVAKEGDEIVFVEVKLRKSNTYGSGIEAITSRKVKNLRSAAEIYLADKFNEIPKCRFDCVEVVINSNWEILHTGNVF